MTEKFEKIVIPVDIFSDVICPWCLVGRKRLEQAAMRHGGVEIAIKWHAFLLNPNMPRQGISRHEYVNAKFGASGAELSRRITDIGRRIGINFAFELIERTPDSRPAHGLILEAGEKAEAIVEELFNAYFIEGTDIGDDGVLAEIAMRHGVAYPVEETAIKQIEYDLRDASRLGIQGVPFFIFDDDMAISGAQPPESFLPLFDAVIARRTSLNPQ